jgi:hypothetical protein
MENIMSNVEQMKQNQSVTPTNGKHELTREELLARISQLEAKMATKQTISFKVTSVNSEGKGTNGAVSLYGVGRFPVTLYKSQWDAVIAAIPALKAFLEIHKSELSVKE